MTVQKLLLDASVGNAYTRELKSRMALETKFKLAFKYTHCTFQVSEE